MATPAGDDGGVVSPLSDNARLERSSSQRTTVTSGAVAGVAIGTGTPATVAGRSASPVNGRSGGPDAVSSMLGKGRSGGGGSS